MSSLKDTHNISDNSVFIGVADKISIKPNPKNFENRKEGEIIYQSGDKSEFFYLVVEGEVKLKFSGARGRDFVTKSQKEFFGEREILDDSDRLSSAVANTDCILYNLKSKEFKKLIDRFPLVKKNLEKYNSEDYHNGDGAASATDKINKIPFDLDKDTIKIKDVPVKKEKANKEIKEESQEKEPDKKTKNSIEEKSPEFTNQDDLDLDENIKKLNFDLNFNLDSKNFDDFKAENDLPDLEDTEEFPSIEEEVPESEETKIITPPEEETFQTEPKVEEPSELNNIVEISDDELDSVKLQETLKESKKLIYASSLEEVGNAIIDLAIKSANAEFGWVNILTRSNSIEKAKKYVGSYSVTLNLEISDEISESAIANNEIINLKDLEQDIRFNPPDTERNFLITSFLAVPIFNEVGMPLAVINLINNFKNAFSGADQKMLSLVSENFSAAIEKANAIEKLTMNSNSDNIKKIASLLQNDVKTPVLTIKHYSSLLKKKIEDKEVARILDLISRHADSIQGMLQTTFDFSFDEIELETHLMNFNDVMNEILELLSDYVESRNVKLFKKFEADAEVKIEKNLFYQVCFQLTKNACDAMPYGGDLYVSTYSSNNLLKLEFKDEGTGIDNDIKERIFDPYFTYNKFDAAGLGLTIAKGIVNSIGGKIEVHSTQGEGSTFTVSLPISG